MYIIERADGTHIDDERGRMDAEVEYIVGQTALDRCHGTGEIIGPATRATPHALRPRSHCTRV